MIKFEKYRIELNALQNPLACYNRLHPYKVGEKEISPRFCLDILSATDNPKVVTELLELVSQKLEDAPENTPNIGQCLSAVCWNGAMLKNKSKNQKNSSSEYSFRCGSSKYVAGRLFLFYSAAIILKKSSPLKL